MIKKLIALTIILFAATYVYAMSTTDMMRMVVARKNSGGVSHTDYTQDANCVAAYFMNSNGGDETDRSGESGTLTQFNGTIPTSSTVPSGYSGTSRDFEVDDSECLIHNDGLSTDLNGANQVISIVYWIKRETVDTTQAVVSKYSTNSNQRQYICYAGGSNDSGAILSADGTNSTQCWTPDDSIDSTVNWFHIAVVSDDTDITIYINGDVATSEGENPQSYTSGLYNGSAKFAIGGRYENDDTLDYPFDGLIDEVAVFSRVLSEEEIEEIMTYGIDGSKGGND